MQPWQINQQNQQQAQRAYQQMTDQAQRNAARSDEMGRQSFQRSQWQRPGRRSSHGAGVRFVGGLVKLAVLAAILYAGYWLYLHW